MAIPKRRVSENVNTLSFVDDSDNFNAARPVPKPRASKGAPVVTKTVETGKEVTPSSNGNFIKNSGIGKLMQQSTSQTQISPIRTQSVKRVDTVTSKSYSDESVNESLKLLGKSSHNSNKTKRKNVVTRHVDYQDNKKSVTQSFDFDQFASDGLEIHSHKPVTQKDKVTRQTSKSVQLKGGHKQVTQSLEFVNFSQQQGFELSESLATDSSLKLKYGVASTPSRQVTFDRDGNKKVTLSGDFEEYTVSTLQSLSDNNLDSGASSTRLKPQTKQVVLKDGKSDVSYSQEFEEYSAKSLVNLKELSDLDSVETNIKPRQVSSRVSFVDGTKNVTYSSDFETFANSLGLQGSKEFHSETDLDTFNKSQDKDNVSWLETKTKKGNVKLSDEFEKFSLGRSIEFTSRARDKATKPKDVYKKIELKDGKRHVSYSDEFLNSLNYSDDFESSASSWAVKVRNRAEQAPITKRVEYRDGKKQVTHSSDVDNTYLEQDTVDLDTASSFKEIALEDLEDPSYTEDFDSTTAKGYSTARSVTSALSVPSREPEDDTEVWSSSTHTPLTSINTNLQYSTETGPRTGQNIPRDTGLYSESYETITSLPHSETLDYSDNSVLTSPRPRLNKDILTRRVSLVESESEDDTYTMTFSQPTVESVEETPEEKRKAQLVREAFLKSKMRVLKKSKSKEKRYIPAPREEKLDGPEAKQYNKFIRSKMKVLKDKTNTTLPNESANSVRCQLRGIDIDKPVENYGISSSVIARLKLENTMHHIKQAATQAIHDPNTCTECSEKMSQYAAEQFMWHKKAIVSEKLVREKTEMQMLQLQDPVWLYAEALRGLPKLSDHRDVIYDKLMRPLYDTYAVNATNFEDSLEVT